ncbi:SusC/RagA family TonB-linked outer membrane protein [Pedobacter sp. KBW01]|uniref:SusC/RagA family TonB-linked outer membrane protein n=1 Tax=Pedobacter sp. KBW01 TaxID=2153364 RepID=UPI000F59A97C|nr:SusC/RagA family TonB-linked outer membrane protein [Pedobacter sp. KBW01]RQO66574.1 SusC/RagA family TonB-linked outer membrane protein [Pedobacter sp. KBW01]
MDNNKNRLNKGIYNKSILLLMLNFFSLALFAQSVNVRGVVQDETGVPLAGAVVMQVSSANSTRTDKDGRFELKKVTPGATIRATFVGRLLREITLKAGETDLKFVLKVDAFNLKEVTVNTGLYKRPVGNFTGSAKTYTGEELKMVNPKNVIQALGVIDPSVRIAQDNQFGSDPNRLPNIQIRGANNLPSLQPGGTTGANPVSNGDIMANYLANPNQPLIILDGFETTLQTLFDMDINLIANITVLKDAAATVAYGSKAANGVIVIETKVPLAGKLKVTYSVNTSVELPDLSSYHLMNAEQLLEAQRLTGIFSDPNNQYNDIAKKQWYDYRLAKVKSGVDTYWLSQPLQIGFGLNQSLSLSGGSGPLRYSFGLNYNASDGAMKGSGRNRYGLSYNVSYAVSRIKLSNSILVGYTKGNNTSWGSFNDYVDQFPYFRNNDENGNPIKILEPGQSALGFNITAPGGAFTNPSYNSTLNVKDYSTILSFTNNTNLDWSITNDLKITGSLGWSSNLPGAETFYPADHTKFVSSSLALFPDLGYYQQLKGKNSAISGRLNGSYRLALGKNTILANLGTSLQKTSSNSTTIEVYGIPNDYLGELGLANGFDYQTIKPRTTNNLTKNLSNYLSLSYNYDNRYTLEFTANQSGSSQFGSNSRFAPFFAGGLAWNIANEKFFKPNDIIQVAKLSASIGTTGNQNFSSDMAQQIYQYNYANNYRLMVGASTLNYANPDLKWQQTLKSNIGLNLGFFKGRLNASIEFFRETTDNLILPLDLAPSTGFSTYQNNLGATKNEGFEVGITAPVIKNPARNIFWTVSFNAGHYTNTITRLSPAIVAINNAFNSATAPNDVLNSRYQTTPLPRFEVGQSMSRIWAVPSLGIDPATGKEVFVKLDGSQTFIWDARDKRPIADATAKIKGSASSSLTYKNFVLNLNVSYQFGGYMYNQTLVDKVENVDLLHGNADLRVLTERWKQPGDQVAFKALVADGSTGLQQTNATSRFVQKDNFLELASLTVGYNFPTSLKWVKAAHLSAPRIMITQNNLLRFATIKTERGTSYPFSRSLNFGITTNF